jgi:proteasome lid subunit RPN8/RPN11
MSTSPVILPRRLVNQLLHCAQSSPDKEVCGLIGAVEGRPTSCYPFAPDPARPVLPNPQQESTALLHMQERGEDLFAVFHSHPASPAEPLAGDLQHPAYPNALHLFISLNTKGVLELRAFRIGLNGFATEVGLLLHPDDEGSEGAAGG